MGHIYWTEMLYRAHMASVASVFRTSRWIKVAIREHEAGSLYGCASACRSLIESAGDINHSLGPVAQTLAYNKDAIRAEISGQTGEPMLSAKEFEDTLIHFTHARKVLKTEKTPDSHKAMQTFQYVDRAYLVFSGGRIPLRGIEMHGTLFPAGRLGRGCARQKGLPDRRRERAGIRGHAGRLELRR
ncbi:hypothetical protein EOA85_20015 [Mesorhizobium sp. M5C.F.Ca.IN.020.29.1.1]|uniref:hypothetical protein n=1 Tax=unclassified Mesorhizobium TaxID=325217 RepID=UPI000FCB388F|nr:MULTISPECIES: hypothetical protein [unclassified Mesorhizobium]RUV55971.1 hypothetical protein EOA85_20015 [Mesorhizobium sp. M5C.F.Ca.IN.020.29.1.1]TIM84185.1 MAG: hypothetical protein E5Y50_23055 [Mesorhizobium sp.]